MDPHNQLDVRLPIGVLFSVIGVLLLFYGLTAPPPAVGSQALNVWWGIVMLVFGGLMLTLGWLDTRQGPDSSA
jgi:hypothetical protein